jgi:hypothetical protein
MSHTRENKAHKEREEPAKETGSGDSVDDSNGNHREMKKVVKSSMVIAQVLTASAEGSPGV